MRDDLVSKLGPVTWNLHPLWSAATPVDSKNIGLAEGNLLSLSHGRIIRRDINAAGGLRPASYETYNTIEAGDTVLRMTDLQNDQKSIRTGLAEERGIVTSAYITVRPEATKADPRFLSAVLRAYDVKKAFYEIGAGVRQTLNYAALANLPIPLPPLATQRRIADFLDRETGDIDAMVGKLDELTNTLTTRRAAAITDAVTGGERGMKTAPEVGLQYLVKFRSGEDYKRVAEDNGPVPVVGSGGMFAAASECLYEGESVLFGRKGTIDKPLHVNGKFWTVDTMFYTELSDVVHGRWLYYWATTIPFGLYSTATALPSMTSSTLGRLKVPVVSLATQRRIADHLDDVTGKIDVMLSKVAELKALLAERRAALITDVVTGRKAIT